MREREVDFKHPYLARQIIAYIGNKRRLLPLIHRALGSCAGAASLGGPSFLDLFAGSGIVSRFARYLGFRVRANDWEPYTFPINRAFLEIGSSELEEMYKALGGLEAALRYLNSLPDPEPKNQYIARHYCPSDDEVEGHDFRRERLFYTRRNGLAIDKIRNAIEDLYPEAEAHGDERAAKEKDLLIALLLYEAATHTNTSGVFKAYHKGFGGHGRDALSRILAPIELSAPALIDSPHPAKVFMREAADLVRSAACGGNRGEPCLDVRRFDVAYLDPPYNQHQYGSNYHLLNTIALWDKPSVSGALNPRGVLDEKAAIRKDWINTRSAYCYRETAARALGELLDLLDARSILLSYSTEGIIPFGELVELCSGKGKLGIVTDEYVKYRGGKQSIDRLNRNIEFVLVIDTARRSGPRELASVDALVAKKRLALLFGKKYSLAKLRANFRLGEREGTIEAPGVPFAIHTRDFFELIPPPDLGILDAKASKTLGKKLEASVCADREEELAELLRKIAGGEGDTARLARLVPGILKKLAHKKHRDKFRFWLGRVREIERTRPGDFKGIAARISEIESIANRRFTL